MLCLDFGRRICGWKDRKRLRIVVAESWGRSAVWHKPGVREYVSVFVQVAAITESEHGGTYPVLHFSTTTS